VGAAASVLRPRVRALADEFGRAPRLAFAYQPRPECVLLDLAIRAAGGVAVPAPVEGPTAEKGEDGAGGQPGRARNDWLRAVAPRGWVAEVEGEVGPEAAVHGCFRIPRPSVLEVERSAPREAPWPEVTPGGVVVGEADESGPRELSSAELLATAHRLGREIDPVAGEAQESRTRRGRDIVVSARSLADSGERSLLAWALLAGAAVVLEPRSGAHVATATWARPTVFAGSAAEVEALARAATAYRSPFARRLLRRLLRRPPARPFDRLHTVLLREGEVPEKIEREWRQRGARILHAAL